MNLDVLRAAAFGSLVLAAGSASAQSAAPALTPPQQQNSDTAKHDDAGSQQGGLNFGKHDSNAPINVASDNFIGDFTTKVGTYIGNVVVVQADYKLKADKVRVEMVKGDPNRFFAYGNVVFVSSSGVATGDNGVYDLNPPRTLTLTGRVVLSKQKDVMKGTVMTVNLDTGESHLTAHGMPGNRVTSLFTPHPHPTTGKPPQTPQK